MLELVEVRENILHIPPILQAKPSTEVYFSIVLLKFEDSKSVTEGLLTQKQYEVIKATASTSWGMGTEMV